MRKLFFMMLTLICLVTSVNAQVTTSGISGKVVDAAGLEVIGANVVALHEASGTTYGAVTNLDGRYSIHGMRTGGPYKLTVTYIGYGDAIFPGIYLQLGNTFVQNVALKDDSELLSEVVVTADALASSGAAQNFSTENIASTPTVDRNIYDVVKNSPLAGPSKGAGLSFAGTNNRYNSFQIDGTVSNDVFGLSSGGTNGGQSGANPVSMEAIQEIQVVVAPFDVRQGGFTGGGINAITKQGDNKFTATAYTYYNDENFWGKHNADNDFEYDPMSEQTSLTYGASIAGPIVKDKLFYYVNVEQREETYPSAYYPGMEGDYLSTETAQEILKQYSDLTGIENENFNSRDVEEKQTSALARLDWNINQDNKFSIRYQYNNSAKDSYSPSRNAYTFANSGYAITNKTNSFVAELSSRINDNLHNEFRASASFVRDNRDKAYLGPNVKINDVATASGKEIDVNIGTEYSSGANWLNQDVYTIEDNVSWYLGDHTLTFGTHNEFYKLQNMFVQAAHGAWTFDGLESFLANDADQFTFKYTDPKAPSTGGRSDWTPMMRFAQFGIYAQDKWDPTTNFSLTYGLRLDMPWAIDKPTTNTEFNTWAAEKGIEAQVGTTPKAKVMISPRLGFRWFANESHSTLLRGGVGIFTGRVPFVWLSNAYTNTGIEQKGTTIQSWNGGDVPALGNYTNEDLINLANNGTTGRPDIVTVSEDFSFPQVLRGNLALEQRLPGGVKMTLEGIYSKTLNNVLFENLAITQDGTMEQVPGVEASAIPYYKNDTGAYNTIINLTNTNKGYSYVLSALFEKSFDFGLHLNTSYTYGRSMSVNDGTSSVAYSNWKYNYSQDPNDANELSFSKFDVPHKVMVGVNYTTPKYFNGLMQTNIGLIYNAYSGSRFSYVMDDYKKDINGDGYTGNNTLYIPTEAELAKMEFSTEADREAFGNWIANDKYASENRGQFAERYAGIAPFEHRIDLHIGQDIFYLKERGSKVQLTFDVMNFANMLNKEWGVQYSVPYSYAPIEVASFDKVTKAVTYKQNKANGVTNNNIYSRWQAQIGCKVIF